MRRILLAVAVLLWSASPLFAQAAQIQAAIQALLQGTNVWTGQTNTFTHDVVILGTCTGCGGGGGIPASPTTSVQFNDGGSFGGATGLEYDKTTQRTALSITPILALPAGIVHLFGFDNDAEQGEDALGVIANGGATKADIVLLSSFTNEDTWTGLLLTVSGTSAAMYPQVNGFQANTSLNLSSGTGGSRYESQGGLVQLRGLGSNAEVRVTSGTADAASGDPGSNVVVTAGDGDTGANGGSIIGHAGGSDTGPDAGRVEWRGGDSTSTARGGALVFQGGASTGANGGNAGFAAGGSSNMGSAGGDVNITVGLGSGGATNGNMFLVGLPTTGATTKKVLCIDTGTGQLFMSTSDTQCLN